MTNTIKHIKDNAEYVTLESVTNVKNVQQFFNEVGDWALKTNGLPIATEAIQGIRRLATQQEVDDGLTDNIVTPKTLAVRLQHPQATESNLGLVRYTKDTEALTFNNLTGATPKTVKYMFENIKATELQLGTSRLATKSQAEAGVSDDVVITPLKLKQGIAALVPGYGASSESVLGLTKLATVAQVREGVIREGFAISPYTFANLSGNETQSGVFKVAKQLDVTTGTSDSLVITPKKLNAHKADDSKYGLVKLTNNINNTDANTALRPNPDIMTKAGGVYTSNIYKTSSIDNNKYLTKAEILAEINQIVALSGMPIGTIIMSGSAYGDKGNYIACDGRALVKSSYPALFAAIGGSISSTHFRIPDLRNRFPRGSSTTRAVGLQENDMIKKHKHLFPYGATKASRGIFGRTNNGRRYGSSGDNANNYWYHTNDGSDYDGVVNPAGTIGHETRPVNTAVTFLIRAI